MRKRNSESRYWLDLTTFSVKMALCRHILPLRCLLLGVTFALGLSVFLRESLGLVTILLRRSGRGDDPLKPGEQTLRASSFAFKHQSLQLSKEALILGSLSKSFPRKGVLTLSAQETTRADRQERKTPHRQQPRLHEDGGDVEGADADLCARGPRVLQCFFSFGTDSLFFVRSRSSMHGC